MEVNPKVAVINPEIVGVAVQVAPVTVKLPPKVVRPVPSKVKVGLLVTLPKEIAVVVADPAVMVEPLMAVVAPTLPRVKAFWVAVPIFRATAVAVSIEGTAREVVTATVPVKLAVAEMV